MKHSEKSKRKINARKKSLHVEEAWELFKQFKKDNADKLLRSNGEIVTARNFEEFETKWKSMKGGNKLNRIEYSAVYRVKTKVARTLRQRLIEEAYEARGISKEEWDNMSIYQRGKKVKEWGIASLEDIKVKQLSLKSKSYLDTLNIKSMIDDFYERRFKEEEAKMKKELGLSPDMNLGDSYKREISKKLGSEISDYFFGS